VKQLVRQPHFSFCVRRRKLVACCSSPKCCNAAGEAAALRWPDCGRVCVVCARWIVSLLRLIVEQGVTMEMCCAECLREPRCFYWTYGPACPQQCPECPSI